MFELDTFIVQGHQKIIDHYRWLRDTARSEAERGLFQQRMLEEHEALNFAEQQPLGAQRAA